MRSRIVATAMFSLCLWSWSAAAQPAHGPADTASMIEAKRMEIWHHTEKLQGIKDSAQLQRETEKHFVMVEELMGLMLAQQRDALAAPSSAPMMMEGEMAMPAPSAPMAGGMQDDAMEMPGASAPGGGMGGGMSGGMEGEMPMPGPAQSGMGGGMMGGMHGEHGGAMGGAAAMPSASDAAQRIAQREALLAELTRHSQYIASLTDPKARSREIVRHQQMLDQLLELMR